ncbi:DNA-directed RNA polymerase subunit omega [Corynebacterium massiliense]|uniref:DNA-directed RNA polymerase subunit omega n=1 Tax=Corynebacterium massiliense DSM 45435 TaxID=1121364 RepID=A0ABY7U7B8_9CORY|nr:DNA-directed RNA polymerase subunit omega [Corynebacterium massiliense]WCZ32581.1 DNA-directed RNA polymerase subunit omega [Corynebacterium massiliense DSM 45435]
MTTSENSNADSGRLEAAFDTPLGITNPPIDELLDKVSSKYALAIFAAKRARQINSYYQEQEEGVFEFVGPLVTPDQGEKPLSIAMREINAELLDHEEGK